MPQPLCRIRLTLLFLFILGFFFSSSALAGPKILSRGDGEEVIEEEPEEEIIAQPAPAEPRVQNRARVYTGRDAHRFQSRQRDYTGLELGMRFGSFTTFDDWVDPDGVGNYGGLGFALRWRFVQDWSFEFGFDFASRSAENADFYDSRGLFNLGILYYLGQPGWGQAYMSTGFVFSEGSMSDEWSEIGSYHDAGLYLGLGGDLYLDDWRLFTEIRATGMMRDDEELDYYYNSYNYDRSAPDGQLAVQWFFGGAFSI